MLMINAFHKVKGQSTVTKVNIAVFAFSILLLSLSYHNIDLVTNVSRFACLKDTNPFGNTKNGVEMYQTGMASMTIVSVVMMLSIVFSLYADKNIAPKAQK